MLQVTKKPALGGLRIRLKMSVDPIQLGAALAFVINAWLASRRK